MKHEENCTTTVEPGQGPVVSRRKLLASLGAAGVAALSGTVLAAAAGKSDPSVWEAVYGKDKDKDKLNLNEWLNYGLFFAVTLAELRAVTEPNEKFVYFITDPGQEGAYVYDPVDQTSADNTGFIVVSAIGARFKRLTESDKASVKWFGAKGDGGTDDMQAIQKTIDAVFARGGGTVFIPAGTYIVSPLREYRIIMRDNVNIEGEGTASIIKVKDNAGDYYTIFGGASSAVPLKNVRISNLRIDQNPQNNLTCNIDLKRTDSYYWQFCIGLYNYEHIVIDNVRFDPTCGINSITLNNENAKYATITGCHFNFVMAKGDPSYDNSAIYVNGKNHTVTNCTFYAALGQKARGAIETHGGQSVVSNNVSDGYYTGVNVQANSTSGEHADITVIGNTFSRANQGIQLWPLKTYALRNVTISGNTISLSNLDHQRPLACGIDSAGGPQETAGYENITITGNTIIFQEELTKRAGLSDAAYGIGFHRDVDIKNVTISDNVIKNAPLSGIRIGSSRKLGTTTGLKISGNMIVNAGHHPSDAETYRAGILVRSTVIGALISDNFISDTYDNAKGLFSIRVHDSDGAYTSVTVVNNTTITKQGGLWFLVSPSVTTDAAKPVKHSAVFPPASGTFNAGDVLLISSASAAEGQTPIGYKVTATGTAGTLTGVTGTGTVGKSVLTVNDVSSLAVEQWIKIDTGDQIRRIVSISGKEVRLNAALTADVSTSSAIRFMAPDFLPFGTVGKLGSIPDTSGAALESLETEVNLLKQALRNYGIINE